MNGLFTEQQAKSFLFILSKFYSPQSLWCNIITYFITIYFQPPFSHMVLRHFSLKLL